MRILGWFMVMSALTACGDPLIDGNYRGEPLFTISGTITVEENAGAFASASTRVAILWIGARQQELFGQGVSQSSFPAQYELTIYNEPEGAQQVIPSSQSTYALARIVLYQDVNANEQLDVGERLIGGSDDKLIAYFPEAGIAEAVGGPFDAGFKAMRFLPCDSRSEAEVNTNMKPAQPDDVDLLLTGDISTAVNDINCDFVPDDLCLQALTVLTEDPDDHATLEWYQNNCDSNFGEDVHDEPKNNLNNVNNEPVNNNPDNNDQASCPPKSSDGVADLGDGLFELCQGTQLQSCQGVKSEMVAAPFFRGGDEGADVWSLLEEYAVCMGAYDPCLVWRRESPHGALAVGYAICTFEYFREEFPEPNCPDFMFQVEEMPDGERRMAFVEIAAEFCPAD